MKRKRIVIIGILFLFLITALQLSQSQEIATEMNVSNSPPMLIMPIPNQSGPAGTDLIDAFNLDDYFYDLNGDVITYTYTQVDNITIIINGNNSVSFYLDPNFTGIRNITFTAADKSSSTNSNPVFLLIGTDTEPPQWHDPGKDKVLIYQSTTVNFTTTWTDNLALKYFYFSIYQGAGWVTYPSINFSGQTNLSYYSMQISASPGSTVNWKFCAFDTTLNSNCTEIQSFTVERREAPSPPPAQPPASQYSFIEGILGEKKEDNFTVEPDSFLIPLKQGTTETRVMKITNLGSSNMSFTLNISELEEMVYLNEQEFVIIPGETKAITIDFAASLTTPPGQYFGLIAVTASETKYVPIIIDVNEPDLGFSIKVEIPDKYKTVMPTETIKANISIQNIKERAQEEMKLYIAIKDYYGNVYDSAEETLIFNSSISLERNLTISETANEGKYIFYARAFTQEKLALDSDTFEVGSRFLFLASLRSSFLFILIFVLCFVALILMVVYSRSKEKERILSLYLMLNELKNLIKEEKFEQAVDLYVRLKKYYGEPVPRSALQDREQLRKEITKLSANLKSAINKKVTSQNSPKTTNKTFDQAQTPQKETDKILIKTLDPNKSNNPQKNKDEKQTNNKKEQIN